MGHERAVRVRNADRAPGAMSSMLHEDLFSIIMKCCESNSHMRGGRQAANHTSLIKYSEVSFF